MNLDNSSDSELNGEEIVRNLEEEGLAITNDLLPVKSRSIYERRYNEFISWREYNKVNSFTENVFLVYFKELSKSRTPSTLWSVWSMLKSTMSLRHNINLELYCHLKAFIRNKAKGFRPKKAQVLTLIQVKKFLNEANDTFHLTTKVILIFGICGALRTNELVKLEVQHVEDNKTIFIVTIEDTKNDYPRTFIIGKEYYDIVKKYLTLRPKDCKVPRLFINYQNGKCTHQVIGKNKISEVPKTIAVFLQLPEPEKYTGHCFRRTAATLLANSGANVTSIKQLGGWRSSSVAEGYVENSLANRTKIYEGIMNPAQSTPSTSKCANLPSEKNHNANNTIISETSDEHLVQSPGPLQNENPPIFVPNENQLKLSHAGSQKRLPLRDLINTSEIKIKKQRTLDIPEVRPEVEIENKVIESVTINPDYVTFNNCGIKQIIINNYGNERNTK